MKIIKNYIWNLSYQVFVLIIPFITIPYISRVLGSEGVGINAYTNSIIQYFILFGSLGFSLYGNREIAYHRNNKDKITEIFWGIFILRCISVLISFIALFIVLEFIPNYSQYIILQSILLFAVIFDISWFFMGVENFKLVVLRNTVIKIISLALIFSFVRTEEDLWKYIAILTSSTLLGNITLIPYLKNYIGWPKLKSINFKSHLKNSLIMFMPQISINIYIILNKTLLGYLSDVQQVGFFDSADKVIKIVLTLVTSLGTVMLPHISSYFSKNDLDSVKKLIVKSLTFVISISLPIMFGLIAISSDFVPIFFGKGYDKVILLLKIESVAIFIMGISNVLGTHYLLPAKMNKEYTIAVTLGAVSSLILNIPLILKFGALGAVITSVFSELMVMLYEIFIVRKYIKISIINIDLFKNLFISIIMLLVIENYINFSPNIFINLVLKVLIGVTIFLSLSGILKTKTYIEIKSIIFGRK